MTTVHGYESLPNLPGYKARMPLEPGDKKHFKKTTLTYLRGYAVDETPVHADVEPPAFSTSIDGREGNRAGTTELPTSSASLTATDGSKGPKWMQNDRKVLRWFGYFKEAVPESPHENHRVRRVVVCHYLSDDTTEVQEPRVVNSGLWQGSFIKRHKIPKQDGTPFMERDLRVGENACMYGRVFRIVDADAFTRDHLAGLGLPMGPAEAYPADPYQVKLDATKRSHTKEGKDSEQGTSPGRGFAQQGRFQAYLLNSKKVLRFYCVWDDRQRLYGDRRPFRLHFYLEDSTTEILEVYEQNSGRDHFPVFLQRCQLPKDPETTKAGKNLDKRLCFGLEDFRLGTFISVYGRDLFIHDCDDFTRNWFQENLGYSPEMMAPVDVREPVPVKSTRTLPPYNGYGSLKDSAENCKHLIPKPPKKDFYKLINKSKIVLRFGVRFEDTPGRKVSEDHSERQFVVSYFMADDSISVFEHPTNGFPGGKFLERGQVPKNQHQIGDIVTDKDLFIGAHLHLYKHTFIIDSADEYTLCYMENNRHEYSLANWEAAVAIIKGALQDGGDALRAAVVEVDSSGSGLLSVDALIEVFRLAHVPIVKHQVVSLYRWLSRGSSASQISVESLLAILGL